MKNLNLMKNMLVVAGLCLSLVVVGCEKMEKQEKKEKKEEKMDKNAKSPADNADSSNY